MIYFVSLVLASALAGSLAIYAWRRRGQAGAKAFAGLAFCQGFMTLSEALSMAAPSAAQALVWFNIRFCFAAFAAVLWLVFTVDFGGFRPWFSRRLAAGLLLIPAATLVVLWTGGRHTLWIKNEIVFLQKGPFLETDPTTLVPGLWFLIYASYSLLLITVSIILLLVMASRSRRAVRAQALLVAASAILAVGFAVIPTFEARLGSRYDPFTPGLGLSTLLMIVAALRFGFLKSTPAAPSRMDNAETGALPSPATLILIFILFTSGISAIAISAFRSYRLRYQAQAGMILDSVSKLKIQGLQDWRRNRLADANILFLNAGFTEAVRGYMADPAAG